MGNRYTFQKLCAFVLLLVAGFAGEAFGQSCTGTSSISCSYVVGGTTPLTGGTITLKPLKAGADTPFTVSASANWITLSPTSGTVPGNASVIVSVTVDPKGLATGAHSESITVNLTGAAPTSVPVTLKITASMAVSPAVLTFTAAAGGPGPPAQSISVTSVGAPIKVSVAGSGAAWLSVSPTNATTPASINVNVNPTGLTADTYLALITVSSPDASPNSQNVTVALTLTDSSPVLSVGPTFMDFRPPGGSTATLTQALQIQNTGGGGAQQFSVAVTEGSSWLSVSPAAGTLTGNQAASVQVSVNPPLALGPYLGSIRVQMGNSTQDVSVSLLVISSQPYIGLEFLGVQFEARTGEGLTYTRDVSVYNRGGGTLNWTATVLSGDDWLSLNQKQGKFTLTTKPGSLAAKAYYATVQIADANAANSPQLMMVVLNVLPATAQAAPLPSPGGLLFVAAGGAAPAAQTVQIFTSSTAPVSFQAVAQTSDGANWLSVSPAGGTTSTSNTGSVTVAVNPAGLKAGVYQGGVSFSISGVVRTTNATLIVPSSGAAAPNAYKGSPLAAGCAATKLVPVYTGLVNNFSSPAGWPTPVTVQLVDDCGSAVANGNIVLNFSKGQPGFLTMNQTDSVNAVYTATWLPIAAAAQINVVAKATAGPLQGTAQVSGAVSENAVPILSRNATVNAWNPKGGLALAPGTAVSLYGMNLAQDTVIPSPGNLPTELKGTQVLIGGRAIPLYFASTGQINAQVPLELEPRTDYQVLVSVNGALSVPDTVNVVPAQPGVLSDYLSGLVTAQHTNYTLVTPDAPAAPGEAVTIYVLGMGTTTTVVPSGAPSPPDPLPWVRVMPNLTLDGQPVTVLYAGLTPYFVGLYQINFYVPPSAANGDLKLVVTQDGREANATTLPVRKP